MLEKFLTKDTLHGQAARYFVAALIGLAFDYGTLIFTHQVLHFYYLLATACGFILGLAVVYWLSNQFVFGAQKVKSRTQNFVLFGLVGLVGLGVLSFFMWLFTGVGGLNYILSKTIATIFVFTWNFIGRRALYHN